MSRETISLTQLRAQAGHCTRCDLYQRATQTVFGEGSRRARVVLVGEQPGDQEDKTGRPLVGPTGRLLDGALASAGIDRGDVYVTNKVTQMRGREVPSPLAPHVLATVHPSSILRAPDDETRQRELAAFVRDLRRVSALLAGSEAGGEAARE